MKLIVKIALGIILALVLVIAGCSALMVGGTAAVANEVQKQSNKTAITPAQYRSAKHGESRKAIVARFGVPADDQDWSATYGGTTSKSSCFYYHRTGELVSLYQLCFDNGKLNSKASY